MPMSVEPRLVLLDTHIWLWLMSGAPQATSPSLRTLVEKLAPDNGVRISAISLWEIGLLVLKNKIEFIGNFKDHIYRALEDLGVGVEAISGEIAMDSTLLPKTAHGDPADRIIIATAKHIGATLITRDKEILSYSKKHDLPAASL